MRTDKVDIKSVSEQELHSTDVIFGKYEQGFFDYTYRTLSSFSKALNNAFLSDKTINNETFSYPSFHVFSNGQTNQIVVGQGEGIVDGYSVLNVAEKPFIIDITSEDYARNTYGLIIVRPKEDDYLTEYGAYGINVEVVKSESKYPECPSSALPIAKIYIRAGQSPILFGYNITNIYNNHHIGTSPIITENDTNFHRYTLEI
jgi:hypothetical protein